jgi:hypothetical protein
MVFDDVFLVILLGQVAHTAATNEPLGREDDLQDVVRVLIDTYFADRLWNRLRVERIFGDL